VTLAPVVGGGGGDLVIPGDPAELDAAAQIYRIAAGGMGDAASQLRGSLGEAANWLGAGAKSHAARVQVLADAHQSARDALYAGSAALATYAQQLAQAQTMASQANMAANAASATARQLGSMINAEAAASKTNGTPGNEGPSSYAFDVAQQNQLQSTLSDHQGQSASLAAQALALANQAAAVAAARFNQVAGMAGPSKKSPFGAGDIVTAASSASGLAGAPYLQLKRALSKANSDVESAEDQLVTAQGRVRAASRMHQVGKAKGKAKAARAAAAEAETDAEGTLKNAKSEESTASAALEHFNALGKLVGMSARDVYSNGSDLLRTGDAGAESAARDAGNGADGLGGVIGDSIPVAGVLLTATLATYDWKSGRHLAAAGDVGGFAASVAAGAVVVLLVGTPAGWAVLATVGVAAGAGFAVTEAIDHYKSIVPAGEAVGHALGDGAEAVGRGIGDAADGFGHEAKKFASWM
jgi:hypothetical protein